MIRISSINKTLPCFLSLFIIIITGCIKRGDNPQDPYETMNRKSFEINQKLDETFFQRPARMMNTVVPPFFRKTTLQVFHNWIEEPRSAINFLLQGKPKRAGNALFRFTVNSTLGIGGIADVARSLKHEYDPTDFGITLAVWFGKDSPYFYSALFGPSTVRDSMGSVYDNILFPPYWLWVRNVYLYSANAYYAVAIRAQLLENESLIEGATFDRYVLIRDAYLQRRHFLITGEEASNKDDDDDIISAAEDQDDADILENLDEEENKTTDEDDAAVLENLKEEENKETTIPHLPKTKTTLQPMKSEITFSWQDLMPSLQK